MNIPDKPLAEAWERYARDVIDNVAPDSVQYRETRNAFYTGAYLVVMTCQAIGGEDVTEAEGVEIMARYTRECGVFYCEAMIDHIRKHIYQKGGE